jgi:hypothetical protein
VRYSKKTGWARAGGIGLLAAISLLGMENLPVRNAYCSAHEFFTYFRAPEKSSAPAGFWERVALSLALTSANSPKPACASERAKASGSL